MEFSLVSEHIFALGLVDPPLSQLSDVSPWQILHVERLAEVTEGLAPLFCVCVVEVEVLPPEVLCVLLVVLVQKEEVVRQGLGILEVRRHCNV